MAGIFGFFDYTKPGPGVPKDGPPKASILVFLEILQRKFWNLIKINLMFNIFNIPALIIAMFASLFVFQQTALTGNASDPNSALSDIFMRFLFSAVLMCIPLITVGPAQAGFTYLLRNYAREEHAFIWDDFKENALKNFKQSMIVSGIDLVITVFMFISIRIYFQLSGTSILMSIGAALMVMMLAIFVMMHLYMYPMLVTFNLTIKQLYKNALIFAIIKLLPNLGITLLCIFLIVLTFFFNTLIGIFLYFFITVSLIGMITNFYAYPKLKKFMMREEEEEGDGEEDDEEESEEETVEDNEIDGDEQQSAKEDSDVPDYKKYL